VIDQHRPATCTTTSLNVFPPVSNEKASSKVDIQVSRGGKQQPRLWFSTVTAIWVVVVAYPNIVEPETAAQKVVDLLDGSARQASSCHFRLVRDDDQEKTITVQPCTCLRNAGRDLDLVQSCRGVRPAIADEGAI
jgi:hypothetical protein